MSETNPVGRPEKYTPELSDKVCERLAMGESMRSISLDNSMPCMTTLFKWLREIPEFTQQYEKAKLECHNLWFEETMDIADDGTNDWMEKRDEEGECIGWRENGEAIQRSRLRVDTRKWALSKLMPKKYGDKLQTEHSGEVSLNAMSDDVLNARIQAILAGQAAQ